MKAIPVKQISSKEQDNTGRFNIREIQEILNGNDLVHGLHKHDFFFVLVLQQGQGRHEIDFIQYEVHEHTVFIIRPGQVHRLELRANSSGHLLEFDRTFYQPKNTLTDQRWKKATSKNHCEVEAARFVKLQSILGSIMNEYSTKQDGYVEAIKANLDLFFIEYLRQSRHPGIIAKSENGYMYERFSAFVQLLETNICHMKSVAQYAGMLNLSSYQLNAITKSAVGKTVSDLINEQIILEAKRYLLATPHQVKDIADHLGYEDASYFVRFFKKQTGYSPEVFRKNFK
ncbi:AraC family transcriptional regulator [Niastella sp. OAS944]|uniref:AraC family transcriptional regulator n=1 Tax=Niastella sp. OAS944 TaxID=2664089 RepID=UPI00346DEB0C|nr:AraC-like DNA-binding protein/mannose-6-phosphate isomerase-like protein (cupin superfamily) [Chitinophagaceae bacterium OAS944]